MRETHRTQAGPSPLADPPQTLTEIFKQLGPGLIIAASIVGSGELIVTTKLGADVGFVLLWFILLGCVIKVFVQIELGRYAIAHGQTTLQALNSLPGPRLGLGWMVYVWMVMYVATFFQLAGIVGSIAEVFRLAGSQWGERSWAVVVALSCAVLLAIGRYRLDRTCFDDDGRAVYGPYRAGGGGLVLDRIRDYGGRPRGGAAVPSARRFHDCLRRLRHHWRRGIGTDLLPLLVPGEGLRAFGGAQ